MPTNYDPERFRALYQEFKAGGENHDQLLIRAFARERQRFFYDSLRERMLALEDAHQALQRRRDYLAGRW
ncbi:MAG: hypothetical protein JRJ56_06255, partial [Deltaproteobacteria bacterium]|nr:hypothetical protein [Deltaproteobacteria bacterium]